MRPTREQIEVAAYQRWERRGSVHGFDVEDWCAGEKDLTFSRNYRWIARYKLEADRGTAVAVGKPEGNSRLRRCRFCEMAEPGATFVGRPRSIPSFLGNTALFAWDECDDCRSFYVAHLEAPFEAFIRPWLVSDPDRHVLESQGISYAAHKALVRMGLGLLPVTELHHFGDTVEWVNNPNHSRDALLLESFGSRVYWTPSPVPSPFASLARRTDDTSGFPYLLFFLGCSRVVFQVRLPLTPRDEDSDPDDLAGPELSMSLGAGQEYRSSDSAILHVKLDRPMRRSAFTERLKTSA